MTTIAAWISSIPSYLLFILAHVYAGLFGWFFAAWRIECRAHRETRLDLADEKLAVRQWVRAHFRAEQALNRITEKYNQLTDRDAKGRFVKREGAL